MRQVYPKWLIQREVDGKSHIKCLHLREFTLNDLHALSSCGAHLHTLELGARSLLEDKPEEIVAELVLISSLQILTMEEMTWLSPAQAESVLTECKLLKTFKFTPRWVRDTKLWVGLYEKYKKMSSLEKISWRCMQSVLTTLPQHTTWKCAPENLTHSTGHLQTSLSRISLQCMVTVILSKVMVQRTYSMLAVIRVKTNS